MPELRQREHALQTELNSILDQISDHAVFLAEAAAIRTVFEQRGELSAAMELRRLFPAITDNVQARDCARTIAVGCRYQ
jgi:hypothetical protein